MPFTLCTAACLGAAWEKPVMELITSRSNPLLVHIRKLLKSRSYRRETGQCVSDGVKLLEEAIRWQTDLIAVLVTRGMELPPLPPSVRCVPGAAGCDGLPLSHEGPPGCAIHVPPARSHSPVPTHRPALSGSGRGPGPRQRGHYLAYR